MKSRGYRSALALLALAAGAQAAAAAADTRPATPLPAPSAGGAPFATASRMDAAELSKITGRDDTAMIVRANNTSTVANNSVSGHSETGTVSFDGQAFGNLAGLSLVSANTGNNVSINSSLNLNVSIRP